MSEMFEDMNEECGNAAAVEVICTRSGECSETVDIYFSLTFNTRN